MRKAPDERLKQIAIGVSIIVVLTVVVTGALTGWRLLPGLWSEWIGMMIGIMTTPFFMEASFLTIGLMIVIFLNRWRQHKDGEELVYLEQVTGQDLPKDLPDQAKWALYRDKPLEGEQPSRLAQAEGALGIGDYEAAQAWLGEMSHEELHHPQTLAVRRDLARATGKTELAEQLENELRSLGE